MLRHRMVDTASMPDCLTERLRFMAATSILATLVVMATVPRPASAAAPRLLADALPSGHPSCHARLFDAAELAAHPDRRVAAISIERTARDLAAERKWGALEQFDGTPIVSATLRVRLRGDPVTHSARLACFEADDGVLVCEAPACVGFVVWAGPLKSFRSVTVRPSTKPRNAGAEGNNRRRRYLRWGT
jgi:hypothetical protein